MVTMPDFYEMRKAVLNADKRFIFENNVSERLNKEYKVEMNYTNIYRTVYESLKRDRYKHEELHSASIRITDAIWELLIMCKEDNGLPETAGTIVDSVLKILN
jgi:hypothetical protein